MLNQYVKYVKGDITDATEDVIAHQVNCQGKMNSGVAKAIRERWPHVFLEYIDYVNELKGRQLLGDCQWIYAGGPPYDKNICNLFGQENYGYDGQQYTNVYALMVAIGKCLSQAGARNQTVAMPFKIGCGRGGANWQIVSDLIEQAAEFHKCHVTFYQWEG